MDSIEHDPCEGGSILVVVADMTNIGSGTIITSIHVAKQLAE